MIQINYRDSRPIYEQVKDGFKKLIQTGILARDEKLPSVREIAGTLAINPNTIQRAYRELEHEGYVYSIPGRGSFVAEVSTLLDKQKEAFMKKLDDILDELMYQGITPEEIIAHIERRKSDASDQKSL